MEVLISAGHSDSDPGAVANGQTEAKLALQLRDAVAAYLRQYGLKVYEDGKDGQNLPLAEAIKLAKGRLAIELHFNSVANPDASGVECIALPAMRYHAQRLSAAVAGVLKNKLRGDHGYIDQSKSARGRLGFVQAGGLILEVCFLSNKQETAYFMASSAKVAQELAKTIKELC